MLKKLLIALTPAGAAALLAGGGTFSSFSELDAWAHGGRRAAAPTVTRRRETGRDPGIVKTKKILLAAMAIAAAAYLGTGGTFATFSADTSNNGDSISSGTLTMNNQVNSGSVCYSANGAVNNNPGCDKVVNVSTVAPGVFTSTETSTVTIQNSGTLDATNFYLSAPYVNGTLTSPVSVVVGSNTPTLQLSGLEGTVNSGDTIVLTYGNNTQSFTANASHAGSSSATTLAVTGTGVSPSAPYTYPTGTIVTDTSSNTGVANTDCYDTATTGTLSGPTGGANLNGFVTTANNPFCTNVAMWVQETTAANQHYCWYGYTTAAGATAGACTAPIGGVTLQASAVCNTATQLNLSQINGNILSGDTLTVTNAGYTCTYTANGTSYVGASGLIGVTYQSCTNPTGGSCTSYPTLPSGSAVSDTKALSDLNSNSGNTVNTISRFDTLYGRTGHLQLYPVTNNGTIDQTTGLVRLAHYGSGTYSRTFQIGFYLPAPSNTNQNTLQGLQSTFGLTWHIEQ